MFCDVASTDTPGHHQGKKEGRSCDHLPILGRGSCEDCLVVRGRLDVRNGRAVDDVLAVLALTNVAADAWHFAQHVFFLVG